MNLQRIAERAARRLELTPVVESDGVLFKRDDLFAPFGAGGPNGSKFRQCLEMTWRAYSRGARVIVSAASVRSPQLVMAAACGLLYGMEVRLIIGGTRNGGERYPNVRIAKALGAKIEEIKVRFNPALQSAARERLAHYRDSWMLPYGITENGSAEEIESFHRLGAGQVRSCRSKNWLIPAGSCNTVVSILYGLAMAQDEWVPDSITLFRIGPSRAAWMEQRFKTIEKVRGCSIFASLFAKTRISTVDLTGVYDYADRVPQTFGGIDFHPHYEGKVVWALREGRDLPRISGFQGEAIEPYTGGNWQFEDSMLWIVGSEPTEGSWLTSV